MYVYIAICGAYARMGACVCVHAYWEYMLSLFAGWIWDNGAVAALPLSGCKIQPNSPNTYLGRPCLIHIACSNMFLVANKTC